jgi:uncharacterized protein (TIGR00251 family)
MVTLRDHLVLEVRLTPRAGRDAIDGQAKLSNGRSVLAVRVRALPEKGAANAAMLHLLAKTCGVGVKSASLVSGATSRLKTMRLKGDPRTLSAALGLDRGQAS